MPSLKQGLRDNLYLLKRGFVCFSVKAVCNSIFSLLFEVKDPFCTVFLPSMQSFIYLACTGVCMNGLLVTQYWAIPPKELCINVLSCKWVLLSLGYRSVYIHFTACIALPSQHECINLQFLNRFTFDPAQARVHWIIGHWHHKFKSPFLVLEARQI